MIRYPIRLCVFVLGAAVLAASCAKKEPQPGQKAATRAPETAPTMADVPRIVLDMVDAHGGMVPWRSAGTVSFEDEFLAPAGNKTVSRVMVDEHRRRAYIDFPGTEMSIAWDGEQAWGVHWDANFPARFLALFNFRLLCLPWLTMDPGVRLAEEGTAKIQSDSTEYRVVMMTFEPGSRDTPHDYYRLYIDPVSKRLRACDYVVTYHSMVPPGQTSTPERLVVYDTFETVNGLVVPTSYTIFESDSLTASCSVRDWKFGAPFDETRMTMPEGGSLDTTVP